jgi:hypothetical protein
MTTDEMVEYRLWSFGLPIDQTPAQFKAWKEQRRKEQAAARSKKYRDSVKAKKEAEMVTRQKRAKATANGNARHAAILDWLCDEKYYLSVSEIMKRARKSHAFVRPVSRSTTSVKGPPEETIVTDLRKVVHRCLDQLEAKGVINTWLIPGRRVPQRVAKMTMTPCHHANDPEANKTEGFPQNRVRHAAWGRDVVSVMPSKTTVSRTKAVPFRVIDGGSPPHRPTPYPHLVWSNPVPINPSAERTFRCDPIDTDTDMAQAA